MNVTTTKNFPGSSATPYSLPEVRIIGFFEAEVKEAALFFRNKIINLEKILRTKSIAKYGDRLNEAVPAISGNSRIGLPDSAVSANTVPFCASNPLGLENLASGIL